MIFNIRGENIEVTNAIRDYVENKVSRIEKYFDTEINSNVYVNLKVYKKGQKAEVTIPMQNLLLRAEETNQDVYASIDIVVDKLERQIRKHKTKVNRKHREKGNKRDLFNNYSEEMYLINEEKEEELSIDRQKQFELQPMDQEEAILQMNMLGHDFFVFIDGKTGKTSAVYRRDENSYGLIEFY